MSFSLRYYKDSESGQPLWFRRWSGAGPVFTTNPAEAARFETEIEAMQSPAYTFTLAPVSGGGSD